MTFNTFIDLLAQHWVLISLVLCPIVVVMIALAALTCEACGAPFGIFRRRNRTIDLCLRCALLHDIRRATEMRKSNAEPSSKQVPPTAKNVESKPQSRHENRHYSTQSPVELGVAGHPGAH